MNILQILSEEGKQRLRMTIEGLIEKCNSEIPMLKKSISYNVSIHEDDENVYHFANVPLLLRLAILDLSVLFNTLLNSKTDNEQNLFARLICGQLYELNEDVPKILGKKYRNLLAKWPKYKEIESELNYLIKKFHNNKAKYIDQLKEIRHNIAHHRDIDGIVQHDLIESLDFNLVVLNTQR